ncbi:MAG: transposase, partial [Victivallales bacterium]|nr:transposase [Victivallales bacterium]
RYFSMTAGAGPMRRWRSFPPNAAPKRLRNDSASARAFASSNAQITVGHFHVVRMANDALNTVRKEVYGKLGQTRPQHLTKGHYRFEGNYPKNAKQNTSKTRNEIPQKHKIIIALPRRIAYNDGRNNVCGGACHGVFAESS